MTRGPLAPGMYMNRTHLPLHRRTGRRLGWIASAACLFLLAFTQSGCYTKRMARMEGTLDTLQMAVDVLTQNQAEAVARLQESIEQQQELMHSMRAGSNLASKDIIDRMEILSAKLDDTADRLWRMGAGFQYVPPAGGDSAGVPTALPVDADPQALYEQAAKDFTQGRFEMALMEFRQLVAGAPGHNLADNAQYGIGESFYALAQYDSAEVAYKSVETAYPRGDKVPAALYKLGMTYEKQGKISESKETFLRLRQEYPRSGEALLAEERLKELERL